MIIFSFKNPLSQNILPECGYYSKKLYFTRNTNSVFVLSSFCRRLMGPLYDLQKRTLSKRSRGFSPDFKSELLILKIRRRLVFYFFFFYPLIIIIVSGETIIKTENCAYNRKSFSVVVIAITPVHIETAKQSRHNIIKIFLDMKIDVVVTHRNDVK